MCSPGLLGDHTPSLIHPSIFTLVVITMYMRISLIALACLLLALNVFAAPVKELKQLKLKRGEQPVKRQDEKHKPSHGSVLISESFQ